MAENRVKIKAERETDNGRYYYRWNIQIYCQKIRGGTLRHGFIVAFSGTFSNGYPIDSDTKLADTGWHLCDGTNGTPDLRGRFILGVSGSHALNSKGGEETHTLNANEMPRHGHLVRVWNKVDNQPSVAKYNDENGNGVSFSSDHYTTNYNGTWGQSTPIAQGGYGDQGGTTDPSGHSRPHNNMPPYYALSYIMKL